MQSVSLVPTARGTFQLSLEGVSSMTNCVWGVLRPDPLQVAWVKPPHILLSFINKNHVNNMCPQN